MYNNSPRFGIQKPTPTPPEVGPFTYILDDCFQLQRVNVVPFGATSERKNTFAHVKYTDALYDARSTKNIVGGHSLRNKAKRFVYKHSDVPPPGTYDPKLPGKRKQPSNIPPPGKGRIYLCNVPYSSLGSSPSIPTKRDAYGYKIGENGSIIKNIVPRRQKEVGPSTYYIRVSSCVNEDPYSGCRWSRQTSARTTYKIKEGPGPAAYDVRKVSTCRRDDVEEEYREMAKRFSYLPRYTEQQMSMAQRQNYPAPNQYEKTSCFTYKPPVTTVVKPFIARKPRFEQLKEREEAFHAIYDTMTPMGYKVSPSVKEIPFTFTDGRFKKRKKESYDPDLYLPKGFTEELIEKNLKPYSLFKPPFDSTVRREINFVAYDSHLKPDCAVYPREKVPPGYRLEKGHSIFLSTTERYDSKVTVAPPVTRYAITECFNKNRNKTSYNKKKLPFLETAERKTVILPHKDNPGPADYMGQEVMRGNGFLFDRTKRFKEEKVDAPPPDHYYIHPLYGESIYGAKNTFNLKIAESVLRTRLRVPPKDTFKDYIKTLKTKKKLRCYATILDE
ncbi:sperm-tail PG-rich repeat-containing protein 2-like [Coccinella septempunctata]|uniref:sperm-tail PG-rich repeat-containing protein 2-like n=1 Tax=Coccinella septempunctata TaxID=41139 RepID=UPI001D05DF6D|nr:sperm-tail PG-rich repeat-containing protein 2-like [Coccinella septempunctata]